MEEFFIITMILFMFFIVYVMASAILKQQKADTEYRKRRFYESGGRTTSNNHDKVTSEIIEIARKVSNDWVNNRNTNKVRTTTIGNNTKLHYTFDNGDTIVMDNTTGNRRMTYDKRIDSETIERNSYTLGRITWVQVVDLFNTIIEQCNNGTANNSGYNRGYSNGGRTTSQSTSSTTNTNHPKRQKYLSLLDTIKAREEHLSTLSSDDPTRQQLMNELNVARTKANKMKEKYGF